MFPVKQLFGYISNKKGQSGHWFTAAHLALEHSRGRFLEENKYAAWFPGRVVCTCHCSFAAVHALTLCCLVSPQQMPWMASTASIANVESFLQNIRLPDKFGAKWKRVFSARGYMNSADWHHLASPLGCMIIDMLDIDDGYKDTFCEFLQAIYALRQHRIERRLLGYYKDKLLGSLAHLEIFMPIAYATINQHILSHLPDIILMHGPLHAKRL